MNIKSVYSLKKTSEEAVADIKEQLKDFNTKMLIYFASAAFEQEGLNKEIQKTFSTSTNFGCSTSGEIISGQMLKNSLVAMAFNDESIGDVKVEVVENIKENCNVKGAFESFEKYYNHPMNTLDFKKYVGIILADGLSNCEEKIMEQIGLRTNVIFIGGSAGDDLKFDKTYVYANGKTYTNAALLALIKPNVKFDFIKTQSFDVLDKKLTANKVNVENREVIEFNNKPAIEAYSEAIGVSANEADKYFSTNSVGLVMGDEIYVRCPMKANHKSIIFACSILEDMEVSILQATDIIKDTEQAVKDKLNELGHISGMINFHCVFRTLELESKGQTEEYGKIFSNIPTIGFSTYGEEYIGHMNQTSTILVFK